MVFVTGDLHGAVDFARLEQNRQLQDLQRSDFLIICGDFGCVWAGEAHDRALLDKLEAMPFTTLFVDGNHENFTLLNSYPQQLWQGGKVHRIRPHVLHLMRGQVFRIEGKRYFTMGGAASPDKARRIAGVSRWPEELPCDAEYEQAVERLEACGWVVDYVITHCAETGWSRCLDIHCKEDDLTRFFEKLENRLTYTRWFFGHYHQDLKLGEHHLALYRNVVRVDEPN